MIQNLQEANLLQSIFYHSNVPLNVGHGHEERLDVERGYTV